MRPQTETTIPVVPESTVKLLDVSLLPGCIHKKHPVHHAAVMPLKKVVLSQNKTYLVKSQVFQDLGGFFMGWFLI